MAQFTYPGVYREEILTQRRVVQDVSTANLALVGFFKKGPVNEAILVTDFQELARIFGDFTTKSIAPTIAAAYYSNGGQNCYVVRTVGTGALRSASQFSDNVKTENSGVLSTGGGSPTAISFSADQTPLVPGSVRLFLNEDAAASAEVIGVGDAVQTVFPFTLANAPVVPSGETPSLLLSFTDGVETFSDNGDGTLTGSAGGTGTINYLTGVGSVTFFAAPLGAVNVTSSYTYSVASGNAAVSNSPLIETVVSQVDGQRIYHGKLTGTWPVYHTVRLNWTDQAGDPHQALVDGAGVISGSIPLSTSASGSLNLQTGVFVLNVSGNEVQSGGTITATYYYYNPLTAEDNGAGVLTVAGGLLASPGTVDYELGTITGTSVNTDLASSTLWLDYGQALHPLQAKNEGESGDSLRLDISVDENFLDASTGLYTKFTVSVIEVDAVGGESIRGTFSEIVLSDLTAPRHISQVLNDPFLGSDLVELVEEFSGEVPTGLSGSTLTGVLVDVGTGSAAQTFVALPLVNSRAIVPGTLVITYTSGGDTRTITDDALGGLTGHVDGGSTASINYDDGSLIFTPSSSPDSATNVLAAYTKFSELDTLRATFAGGNDGAAITRNDVTGISLSATGKGIYALDTVDDLLMLVVPDFAGDQIAEAAQIAYVSSSSRQDSMVIISPPEGSTVKQARDYKLFVLASNSNRAAMYYPWIQFEDPITGNTINLPPHGHVAGVWSRTDLNRTVGKAPAGINDGALTLLLGFESELKNTEVGQLNEVNINALWQPPRQPRSVWGARTLEVGGEFRYINKRRTIDFVSVSIARSMWWAVFENAGPGLWVPVRQQIEGFLRRLFLQGVLAGSTQSEAFFVKVDGGNNPPEVVEQGQIIVDYGVATNTPGEFIRLRHRQIVG